MELRESLQRIIIQAAQFQSHGLVSAQIAATQ